MKSPGFDSDCGPRIGVVVVAFRSSDVLEECLVGVLLDPAVFSVVVIDNSSDSDSREVTERLSRIDGRLSYDDPGANLGFAVGCNLGVMAFDDDWTHVFFVNPDVSLSKPLAGLAHILDASPQQIVAGALSTPSHPRGSNARPLVSFSRELLRSLIGNRAYALPETRASGASNSPFLVEQVDGALLGMSRGTYERLGGFDSQFELYFEDVDICRRAASDGGCLFVPQPWGLHVGGASSSTVSSLAYCLGTISRIRYFRKHRGDSVLVSVLISCIGLTEFFVRSATLQSEGFAARARAIKLQFIELIWPGSIKLLSS